MDFFNMLSGSKIIKTEGTKIQSDYVQNDPGAKDYIKNRPFYSEGEKIETIVNRDIISLQEVKGKAADGAPEGFLSFPLTELDSDSVKKLASIVDKGQYNLTIDGITEQITTIFSPDMGCFLFGNLSVLGMGDDTGEIYIGIIAVDYDEKDGLSASFILALQTTEITHTIGFSHIGDTVSIVPESTLTFSEKPDPNLAIPTGYTAAIIGDVFMAVEEDITYNLSINGKTYKNLTFTTLVGGNTHYLGNLGLLGQVEDTGEEYFVAYLSSGNVMIFGAALPAGDYKVSLEKVLPTTTVATETVHKIDSKFISTPDYSQNDPNGEGYIKNRPFYSEGVYVRDIVPLQKAQFKSLSEEVSYAQIEINSNRSAIAHNGQYNLTIDDKIYPVTVTQNFTSSDLVFTFGNLGMVEPDYENTGEDYAGTIIIDGTDLHFNFFLKTIIATHKVGLSYIGDTVPLIVEDTGEFLKTDTGVHMLPILGGYYTMSIHKDDVFNIVFNGKSYENIALKVGPDMLYLGNASLVGMGSNTGENWCLVTEADGGNVAFVTNLGAGPHTLSMEKTSIPFIETIHKIDSKYVETPYIEEDNGDAIFKRDVYIDDGKVSLREIKASVNILEANITTSEDQIENLTTFINSLPRQLQAGFVYDDDGNQETSGLSAGTGVATGANAWAEGSAGASGHSIDNISGITLQVEKITSGKTTKTRAYLNLQCYPTSGALTPEDISNQVSGYEYFKIRFKDQNVDENKVYYIKKHLVTINSSNNSVEIEFSFLAGNDSFSIDTANNGQLISKLIGYEALGTYSHSEGEGTIAQGDAQHTQGKYNIIDTENKYAHIIGNGTNNLYRSNAHTVDWYGNGWFAGAIEATGIILPSTTEGSTKRFLITVDDTGVLTATEITE